MDRNEERLRGMRAAEILRDPLVESAFEELRFALMSEWENSTPDEAERREQIFNEIKALNAVRDNLVSHIETGKMAAIELGYN